MRLIDANSAKSSILVVADCITIDCDWLNGYKTGLLAATEAIDEIPTIEAEPVKHGRWIIFDDGGYKDAGMKCSCCNTPYENYATTFHYCPNCGAKMDGDQE